MQTKYIPVFETTEQNERVRVIKGRIPARIVRYMRLKIVWQSAMTWVRVYMHMDEFDSCSTFVAGNVILDMYGINELFRNKRLKLLVQFLLNYLFKLKDVYEQG